MELTREYFDQQLKKVATKKNLEAFATKGDLKQFVTKKDLEKLATKNDLKEFVTKNDLKEFVTKNGLKDELQIQTQELKDFARVQTESLARIISTTVAEPMEKHFKELQTTLTVKQDVEKLKYDMKRIKRALALNEK